MSLPKKGTYIITSKVDGAAVGRNMAEDMSLLPKPVYVLPPGVDAPRFIIEHEQHQIGYSIKALGALTGVYIGFVYAFLLDNQEGIENWIITPVPQHGPNVYIIETQKRDVGWVVDENGEEGGRKKIALSRLLSTKSFPPFYSDVDLWNIVRIDCED